MGVGLLGTKKKVPLKPLSSTAFGRKELGNISPGEKGVAVGVFPVTPARRGYEELRKLKLYMQFVGQLSQATENLTLHRPNLDSSQGREHTLLTKEVTVVRWGKLPRFLDLPLLVPFTVPASQLPLGTGLFLLKRVLQDWHMAP